MEKVSKLLEELDLGELTHLWWDEEHKCRRLKFKGVSENFLVTDTTISGLAAEKAEFNQAKYESLLRMLSVKERFLYHMTGPL